MYLKSGEIVTDPMFLFQNDKVEIYSFTTTDIKDEDYYFADPVEP
jgi:hypothetical protein